MAEENEEMTCEQCGQPIEDGVCSVAEKWRKSAPASRPISRRDDPLLSNRGVGGQRGTVRASIRTIVRTRQSRLPTTASRVWVAT